MTSNDTAIVIGTVLLTAVVLMAWTLFRTVRDHIREETQEKKLAARLRRSYPVAEIPEPMGVAPRPRARAANGAYTGRKNQVG